MLQRVFISPLYLVLNLFFFFEFHFRSSAFFEPLIPRAKATGVNPEEAPSSPNSLAVPRKQQQQQQQQQLVGNSGSVDGGEKEDKKLSRFFSSVKTQFDEKVGK